MGNLLEPPVDAVSRLTLDGKLPLPVLRPATATATATARTAAALALALSTDQRIQDLSLAADRRPLGPPAGRGGTVDGHRRRLALALLHAALDRHRRLDLLDLDGNALLGLGGRGRGLLPGLGL